MGIKTTTLSKKLYFITSTVIDWMDIFTRPTYKHIVTESLEYCQANKGLEIYAWVLMTNHLHMIIGTRDGYVLSDTLRDFKKYTSKTLIKAIQNNPQESRKELILNRCKFRGENDNKVTNFKFWQDDNYIEQLYSYDFLKQKLDYIHQNPVRQEIVESPEDYLYSSARNYHGQDGILKVTIVR